MLTGEQLRAARTMLKMEQGELAELANVSIETIKRLERMDGELKAQTSTISDLINVLEQEGAVFLPPGERFGPAIALRLDPPPSIRRRRKRGES